MFTIPLYLLWLAGGFLLIILELLIPGFIIFFFGVGALLTGVLLFFFQLSLAVQLVIFAAASIISLLLFRRLMPRVFQGGSVDDQELPAEAEESSGKTARVVETITSEAPGKIEFEGSFWTAVSDTPHQIGEVVTIIRRDNLTMIVR